MDNKIKNEDAERPIPGDEDVEQRAADNSQYDEFFGAGADDEDLDASETDEDEDEGMGNGKIGRSRENFPPK